MKRLRQKTPRPAAPPCASAASGPDAAIGAVAKASSHQKNCRVQLHGQRMQCGAGELDALRQELQKAWDETNWSKKGWASRVKQIKKKPGAWGSFTHGGARKKPGRLPLSIGDAVESLRATSGIGDAVECQRASSAIADKAESERYTSAIGDKAESERDTSAIGDAVGSARAMPASGDGRAAPVAILTPTKVPSSGPLQADPQPEQGLPETLPKAVRDWRCSYTVIERLSGGAYGEVYTAKPKNTRSSLPPIFVVKLMHKTKQRARATSDQLREIQLMKELSHPNVLKLLGWRGTHFNVQLLFEKHDMDLRMFIKRSPVAQASAKILAKDLFSAVDYVHSHFILHRDIKPQNILVQSQPLAGIQGDFGLSRKLLPVLEVGQQQHLSADVCTLWYRAPEILLAHHDYGYPSDVWSMGIVLVEMAIGTPPVADTSEIGMLFKLFREFGTPNQAVWRELIAMREYTGKLGTCPFPSFPPHHTFPYGIYCEAGIQLARAMLQLSPSMRVSAHQATEHAWFR